MSAELAHRKVPETERRGTPLAYNPDFDRKSYVELSKLKNSNPESYEKSRRELNEFTRKQMETHLGERFNVLLSRFRYEIVDGKICGFNNEPFEETIKRGRDYRRKFGNPADWPREDAEVEGFAKIQAGLLEGKNMFQFSPRGGSYDHNFYDVFTLREDDEGKKYVEARRYSSYLSQNEASSFIPRLNAQAPRPIKPSPEFFLSHPIEITGAGLSEPDEIHKLLHGEHNYTSEEEFENIKKFSAPFVDSYIKALEADPYNIDLQRLTFNGALNAADDAWRVGRGEKSRVKLQAVGESLSYEDIFVYGNLDVREVKTGCGFSGGFGVGGKNGANKSPFSVSEYGVDQYGSLVFECPDCRGKNIRPVNSMVERCQKCGSSAVGCDTSIEDVKAKLDRGKGKESEELKKVA